MLKHVFGKNTAQSMADQPCDGVSRQNNPGLGGKSR